MTNARRMTSQDSTPCGRPRVRAFATFVKRLSDHQVGEQATVIAFNIIYAMFPLTLSLAAIGGFIFHGAAARAHLLRDIRMVFPDQVAREIGDVVNAAGRYAGLLGVVAFVSLLWFGSSLFTAIEVSFSRIFDARPRGIIRQRAIAFVMIAIFSGLLVVAVGATQLAVPAGRHWHLPIPPGWSQHRYLGVIGGWLASTLMHLVIYAVIPNVRLPFIAVWPGALLAGTAMQLVTLMFPLYIRYLGGFNWFGDAFSLVFLVMTWAYLVALILLVGAEVNALCYARNIPAPHDAGEQRTGSRRTPSRSSI